MTVIVKQLNLRAGEKNDVLGVARTSLFLVMFIQAV
jgi:hypothetical protein